MDWFFAENKDLEGEVSNRNFTSAKWHILVILAFSYAMSFGSLVVIGVKIFHPFHILVGVALYLSSYVPFFWTITLAKDAWQDFKTYDYARHFLQTQKYLAILLNILILMLLLWLLSESSLWEGTTVDDRNGHAMIEVNINHLEQIL